MTEFRNIFQVAALDVALLSLLWHALATVLATSPSSRALAPLLHHTVAPQGASAETSRQVMSLLKKEDKITKNVISGNEYVRHGYGAATIVHRALCAREEDDIRELIKRRFGHALHDVEPVMSADVKSVYASDSGVSVSYDETFTSDEMQYQSTTMESEFIIPLRQGEQDERTLPPKQENNSTQTTEQHNKQQNSTHKSEVQNNTVSSSSVTCPTQNDSTSSSTKHPKLDIEALLAIIANLTYDYDTNLTDVVNITLQKYHIPTCGTPTTTTPIPTTTEYIYDFNASNIAAKCFVCGLEEEGIPRTAHCADAFAGDFLPLAPVDPTARGDLALFRKYCRYMDVHNFHINYSEPRTVWGRWTGGCAVRWMDLSGVYTQRTCRIRDRPILGKHFASKRMAKLEKSLINVDEGCIVTPMASLVPLSRGVSLYARFYACVCMGSWCNRATNSFNNDPVTFVVFIIVIMLIMEIK